MKRKIILLATLGCALMFALTAGAQTVSRNVSGYSGIECNGPFNVSIKIDGTESIKLDVDTDILDDLKTEVEDGVLKVEFKSRWKSHNNVKRANIYITAKRLSYVGNGGSGNIVVDGDLTGDRAKISLSGSGGMKASVKSGALNLGISGSGGIAVSGNTGLANISISGSGDVNARKLETATVEAKISGSGGVNIIANEAVSARISGSGGVQFTGNAKIAETHYSGSGRVSKAD